MTEHDTGSEPAGRGASRRDFLRRAGIGAAGLAMGGATGAAITATATAHPPEFAPLAARTAPGFEHVVVLMFENRSFDNLLGRLYTADEKTIDEFDGLAQGSYANPDPNGGADIPAYVYDGSTDVIMQSPQPDPGETYSHVNTQLFGVVDPPGNEDIRANGLQPPFNAPPVGATPTNDGFVRDFVINYRLTHGTEPTAAEYRLAMGGFAPTMLPVLSTLARQFAVYDRWFSAAPTQTYPNRSFFHASTSHGYVTNHGGTGYEKWIQGPLTPTIFNRLEEAGLTWRVYYDASQLISLTGMLHAPVLREYWTTNFRDMDQFALDAANGDLPAYAFVEPRMVFNHNDMHPPWGEVRSSDITTSDGTVDVYNSALSDVRAGDALAQQVYDAIRTSASPTGSNALNTALLITFDEHGGTYDHVPPPEAVPPDGSGAGEMGFAFDRFGPRVPSILVSAYTAAGTVIHDQMSHGSVTNTLCRLHGLRPLSVRDETANPIFNAINLTTPRQPYTWPQPQALYVATNPEESPSTAAATHKDRPLTSPARGLLGLLIALFDPTRTPPTTYAEAYDELTRNGDGLFGTKDPVPTTPAPTPSDTPTPTG